ncbi:hypothetical protein EI94DRAFT_1733752 [Lactarius quietus]|nr:hypothetical protein EI94DRAFT_1733752 [Lactarius quietus]
MEGENRITLMGRVLRTAVPTRFHSFHLAGNAHASIPACAECVISMPNMYACGILFGKVIIELGDACTAHNDAEDLHADLEFKAKGHIQRPRRARPPRRYGARRGEWQVERADGVEVHQDGREAHTVRRTENGSAIAPEDTQEPYESRRLWRELTRALFAKDMDVATAAKSTVENARVGR